MRWQPRWPQPQAGNRRAGGGGRGGLFVAFAADGDREEGREEGTEGEREGGCRYEAGTEESEEAAIVVVTCCTS